VSRVLLTGGAGFIGGVVARQLRERGDAVVAIVRDPARAGSLSLLGVELVAGDLSSVEAIASAADGVDAVIHAAGSYRIGILPEERPAMLDANEGTAVRVLEAAARAGVGRTVVVSTVGVFGDTRGRVVDETFQRDLSTGFLSYYDESKWRAHVAALRADPSLGLAVLEPLRADPSKYVRDSVANWLNDASKDDPAWVRSVCARWTRESRGKETAYTVKRALRTIDR